MSAGPSSVTPREPFGYPDELALVTYLVNSLERWLAGRHETRVLRTIPSDHCHLGVLGPRDPHIDEPEPIEVDEGAAASEPTAPATANRATSGAPQREADEDEEGVGSEFAQAERVTAEQRGLARDSTRRPPSSLGFEIVARSAPASQTIELTISLGLTVYTQHFPTFDEQRDELGRRVAGADGDDSQDSPRVVANQARTGRDRGNAATNATAAQNPQRATVTLLEVFVRRPIQIPPITVRIDPRRGPQRLNDGGAVQHAIAAVLAQAATDPTIWRSFNGNAVVPVQALASQEAFEGYLRRLGTGGVMLPPLRASLDIRTQPSADGTVRIRCYLRNDTPRDLIQRFRDTQNILADCQVQGTLAVGELLPVELLPVPRDYQFDRSVWAVGHGASVVVSPDRRAVRTESLARFRQSRRATNQEPTARFDELATDPFQVLERIRQAMVQYGDEWQRRIIDDNERQFRSDEREQCHRDLLSFRDEEARFAAGIAALAADERLLRAFIGMNRVFQRSSRGRYASWHLFQLVFIVTQLPSLAIREQITSGEWPPGRERTWDDALDWADVLWFPTGGGKTEAYLGLISCAALYDRLRGKRFGVTAWLRFPLRMLSVQQLQRAAVVLWETEQERRTLLGAGSTESEMISLGYFVGKSSTPNQLRANDPGEWSFANLERDSVLRDKLLLVSSCPACQGTGTVRIVPDRNAERIRHVCSVCQTYLPIYVSDDEVYRFLPTVIVGTIDKMATVAFQVKFAMLWGGAVWRCQENSEHGYGIGDWCTSTCTLNPRSGSRPRARTAVTPYDPAPCLHIQDELHLLQQELGAFAGHYETLIRACETAVGGLAPKTVAATATIEGFEHQIRQIYGLPHARRFPTRGFDLLETFYTTADRDSSAPDRPIKTSRIYVAFRPPHLHAADAASLCCRLLHEEVIRLFSNPYEAAAFLPTARTEEEVRSLLYYYSTTLTYVGSKARGVRIRQNLDRAAGQLRPGNARDLATEFLSGDSSLATIAETVRRIETPPQWSEDGFLDAAVATNVISHGVDVERFNLMVMDSVPEETADYIQASSRSGRRHVGLVLSVLASYSLRASSIYHRFTEYHQHLERLVSPVSVNRFAKFAAVRTSPGILAGLLLGRFGPAARTDKLGKRTVAAALLTPGTPSDLRVRVSPEQLQEAVEAAYALGQEIYPEGLELAMRQVLAEQIQRFLYLIRGSQKDRVVEILQPKPMTSLRDVDVGVMFRPEEDANWQELQWFNSRFE
ncbi:MAG: hypothetical protein L0387_15950 [Acidobacteria bacterium]|nr:hypothetical protein [Acidobacteriota bacterium]